MEIINQAFEENSILWLILSAFIGGVISYSLKFFFDQFLGGRLNQTRVLKKLVVEYSTPLLKTGLSLERRINNLVRNSDKEWFQTSEYYKISTLYIFCEFFGWVYILEKKTSFLKFPSSRKTKDFESKLYGIFRAITSFAYFRQINDIEKKDKSNIPRLILTAIGEIVTIEKNGDLNLIDFTEFAEKYNSKSPKFKWLSRLEEFLIDIEKEENSLKWDRLILLGANLKKFVLFLDKEMLFLKDEEFANLDLIKNPVVKESFLKSTN